MLDRLTMDLFAAMADELRPQAFDDFWLSWIVEEADKVIAEYWANLEPTDAEILRTSRSSHDLDGYDLGDPKRITLERENRL